MPISAANSFGTRDKLNVGAQVFEIQRLENLEKQGLTSVEKLPFSLRILLENLLRFEDGRFVRAEDIRGLANWKPNGVQREIAFMPARVLLQDFTGVPAIVDLATMREAVQRMGGNPKRINPLFQAELVIDHSVQVDNFGGPNSFGLNAELEFQRNAERYAFLRWGQTAFRNFKVVPPDTGICHQVNIEYLARVVCSMPNGSRLEAFPDSLVGTDSHTTMVNSLGVFGWGVGGIEAEAAMLGQPLSMLVPEVVGFKLHGQLERRNNRHRPRSDRHGNFAEKRRGRKVRGILRIGAELVSVFLIAPPLPTWLRNTARPWVSSPSIKRLWPTSISPRVRTNMLRWWKPTARNRCCSAPTRLQNPHLAMSQSSIWAPWKPTLAGPKRPQDRVALKNAKTSFVKVVEGNPVKQVSD